MVKTLWVTIFAVALVNAAIKAAGPLLVAEREIPPRAQAVVALLPPALLAALVVTQTFGADRRLGFDERVVGVAVAAAALALALRAPVLLVGGLAVVVTALLRALVKRAGPTPRDAATRTGASRHSAMTTARASGCLGERRALLDCRERYTTDFVPASTRRPTRSLQGVRCLAHRR